MTSVPEQFVESAIAAADAARLITTKYFRASASLGSNIDNKSDCSPVTIADRETEQCLQDLLLKRHPSHSFIGEESGATENDSEWKWVIDPIDGTKSFATGNPTFGTLIALLHDGKPVLGVIDHAVLNERWVGIRGHATTHNGTPCTTNSTADLATATLYATTIDMFTDQSLKRFNKLSAACRFRVFGGDCYAYSLLSCGFTEVVCEAQMKAHDYLALIPVVEGAGGVITDWQGNELTENDSSGGEVVATANEDLHKAALEALL